MTRFYCPSYRSKPNHEKLEVHQESLAFVAWTRPLLQTVPKSVAVYDQLDRASTSIVLNLAEGSGEFTSADRCRFFDIARGSAWSALPPLIFLPPKAGAI
jgi:hypothetical protein